MAHFQEKINVLIFEIFIISVILRIIKRKRTVNYNNHKDKNAYFSEVYSRGKFNVANLWARL